MLNMVAVPRRASINLIRDIKKHNFEKKITNFKKFQESMR